MTSLHLSYISHKDKQVLQAKYRHMANGSTEPKSFTRSVVMEFVAMGGLNYVFCSVA
jgi:hypothetical protein